ncbi:MAG TPA: M23 family metallopeptidase [Myxococcales bacterium]|nr:M23 family metallopeptidase [Myxococcales bacterium]
MADKSIAGEVEGDYGTVKVQVATVKGDDVKRPTKGTQLVWGGDDKTSPWGHVLSLIEKAGGSVAYTFIHAADLKVPALDVKDEGEEDEKKEETQPAPAEEKKDDAPKPPDSQAPGGIEGHGDLFENGLNLTFAKSPARIWAHPHCFMSGPRPLFVLLHGINGGEQLDYPLLNEHGIHVGKIVQALVEAGKVTPVVIAAPTQKVNAVWRGFDFEAFITAVVDKLKDQKVEIDPDQVSIVGHSAGGGSPGAGINLVAEKKATFLGKPLKLLGCADTRTNDDTGAEIKKGLKDNDKTIVYSMFRPRGGWMSKGDSWESFIGALGLKAGTGKPVEPEDEQDILGYAASDDGKRISMKLNTAKIIRHRDDWKAAGGLDDKRTKFEHDPHWDFVPLWFTWGLQRFFPAGEADKHAGLSAHPQEPKPPEEPPRAPVTGGEWADVPPGPSAVSDDLPSPKQVETALFAPATGVYWPVRNPKIHYGRTVSYVDSDGKKHGVAPNGRDFLANRPVGTVQRFHAGIDVFADDGDIIVACEAGKVMNTYLFYKNVWCLIVQHDSGVVINYGEVKPESLKKYGMKKGVRVQPGQPIAQAGRMTSDAMLHFETYPSGTTANVSIKQAEKAKKLPLIFNPTAYLIALAKNGK